MNLPGFKELSFWFNLDSFANGNGMITYPFNHIIVDNALTKAALKILRKEAAKVHLDKRAQHPSGRYKHSTCLNAQFKNLLSSQAFMKFLKTNTKNNLRDRKPHQVAPSFYYFKPGTGRLPMHNDYYEKLSYEYTILIYLHKKWQSNNGGRLCLHDKKKQYSIVKKVDPLPNRLVIFEPTKKSFHSVQGAKGDWVRLLLNIQIYGKKPKKKSV